MGRKSVDMFAVEGGAVWCVGGVGLSHCHCSKGIRCVMQQVCLPPPRLLHEINGIACDDRCRGVTAMMRMVMDAVDGSMSIALK